MVVRGDKIIGIYEEYIDALEALVETGSGEIYRVELITRLDEDETHTLKDAFLTSTIEPVEAPIRRKSEPVIVFDRGYGLERVIMVSRKLHNLKTILLSVSAKDVEEKDNVKIVPVRDEIDVKNYIDELRTSGYKVLFFTSDKKLYTHLANYNNVKVFYKILSSYRDENELINSIISDIRKSIGDEK